MKVKDLVARLQQFNQDAELEMVSWPDSNSEIGSVYDDTADSAIYWPKWKQFQPVATKVVIELDRYGAL